tara:strand:- start:140 stop:328 length:189 start_codon:yes stop_codon:yes gene_type:complete
MERISDIIYVGQEPAKNDVDCYNKKTITKDINIEATGNALFAGPVTINATLTIESGATVVIV